MLFGRNITLNIIRTFSLKNLNKTLPVESNIYSKELGFEDLTPLFELHFTFELD